MKFRITVYWVTSIFVYIFISCSAQNPAKVRVEGGMIQGTIENGLTIYKGIPFAAPPVGELRWRAPQPVKKWEGVRQTTMFAPSPMQGGNPPAGKSEDCLYLNVWTPVKSSKEQLPVLVWIYGGGFGGGSTAYPVHDGANLAKKGVVLVSIAYRVGQLGFLCHPELSSESPDKVSGNYGLLDQIAALKWIQQNITKFGGDPNRVTIFGESAGGIAVSMLCASPLAKGLFHGAISQSGGSFGPTRSTTHPGENMKTLGQAEVLGASFMREAGASTIAELRKVKADMLPAGRGVGGSWPVIDGFVIPDNQYELYENGSYNDVPVLIGYNSDEGASFSTGGTREEYIKSVKTRYGDFANDLIEAYPVGTDENKVPKTARDLMRDSAFGWHTWSWAHLQSQNGKSKVYYYYFDQHPICSENSPLYGFGSPHGQDVAYVFMNLDPSNKNTSASDIELSEIMGTYWTNFAKFGNPNGNDLPIWPAFTDATPNVIHLNADSQIGTVPSEKSMKVLDAYFKWRFTTEGKAWANEH